MDNRGEKRETLDCLIVSTKDKEGKWGGGEEIKQKQEKKRR